MCWKFISDKWAFSTLQALLFLIVVVAMVIDIIQKRHIGQGGLTAEVTRGDASMAIFYGAYVALTGLLVAICLSVEVIKNYRVAWSLFNTIEVAYLCLYNSWFRNHLLHWAIQLTRIEQR